MSYTILYVEDNPYNARLLQKLIKMKGFECLIAKDAMEGLDLLEQYDFDLIFLDINMPHISGVELVKLLKADTRYQIIPTIALTANSMHGDRDWYINTGFDNYLAKPLIRAELDFMLRHYLTENSH